MEFLEILRYKWVYYKPIDEIKYYATIEGIKILYRRYKRWKNT